MQVLAREGVSVSDFVRDLFAEMEKTQKLPEFASAKKATEQQEIQRKRELLRSMVGIAPVPPDYDYREEWLKHLEWKHRPGVRA